MPESSQMVLFITGAFIIIVVPGPNILYLVARSLHQGRMAGFASVLGIEAATLVHLCAAIFGLTSLLTASAHAFTAVKYVGAAYLIYLGVRKLLEDPEVRSGRVDAEGLRSVFLQGFMVNLLNPKTAMFFLAFLPQFVNTGAPNAKAQILAFGLTLIVLATSIETGYVFFSNRLSDWFESKKSIRGAYQRRLAGSVYIGLGLATALTGTRQR